MNTEVTTTSEIAVTGQSTKSKPTRKTASRADSGKQSTSGRTTRAAKSVKPAKARPKSASKQRGATKTATVLELLRRKEGVTIADIAKATEWQNHSIRGFLSGTVTKKMGLSLESSKDEGGERTYRITE